MVCLRCLGSAPEGQAVCGPCGQAIDRACPNCGELATPTAKFCHECGTKLIVSGAGASSALERRQVTLLFCDMVGSSALATRLDPEEHCDVIASFHACCAAMIQRFDGIIAQYQGDGVLAYFGYPQAHEDDAERAVRAGLALVEQIPTLRPTPGIGLQARIGMATGLVVVGDLVVGNARQQHAAYGESINLAARLQSIADANSVVIDPQTYRLVGGMFHYRDLGMQTLKGFREPVHARQVLRASQIENRFEARPRSNDLPLIGRDGLVDSILRRWEQAKTGKGSLVLLSGEAGIGKSRVTQSIHERLAAEPHICLVHHGSPYHRNAALHPIISRLVRAAGFAPSDDRHAKLDKLKKLLQPSSDDLAGDTAIFADLLSVPLGEDHAAPHMTPRQHKERTLEAMMVQLRGLCVSKPVLLIFEDVHWVDPTSIELLTRLVGEVAGLPLLAVVTARPEFAPPWPEGEAAATLRLTRLGQAEARKLIANVAGDRSLPDGIVDQILQRTDGVPLFIEELTKTVLESTLLRDSGDRLSASGKLPLDAIPLTLHSSLLARLDHLAPVKAVAQIGAAIGREFSYEVISAVASLPEDALRFALERLIDAELLFQRGRIPAATFRFKHALVRDAAYWSLVRTKRQELHRTIARVLEGSDPGSATGHQELLGHHYSLAADYRRAIASWKSAAEQAVARSALVEAANLLEKAIEVVPHLGKSDERSLLELELTLELATVLRSLHGYAAPKAEKQYLRARQNAPLSLHPSKRFSIEWGLFQCYFVKGDIEASGEIADQLLNIAAEDAEQMADARIAQGMVRHLRGDLVGARGSFEAASTLTRPATDAPHFFTHGQNPGVFCTSYLARTLWFLGYADDAKRMIERNLVVAEARTRDPAHLYSYANALASAAGIHVNRREPKLVRDVGERLLSVSDQQDFSYYRALARIDLAWADCFEGDAASGLAEMREGLVTLESTGTTNILPGYYARLAEALGRAGQTSEALEVVERVRAPDGTQVWDAEILRVKGDLLALLPDMAEQSAAAFIASLEIARTQRARSLELRTVLSYTRLLITRGRAREAYDLLRRCLSGMDAIAATEEMGEARSMLHELSERSLT